MHTCSRPSIVVHGGAGSWRVDASTKESIDRTLLAAVRHGYEVLIAGGSAVEAVVESVKVLEDSGILNAGTGSVLNALGEVEMDAGVMDGKTLRAGAVAAVKYPKNPIELAKIVMEKTDHIIIVGEGADRLARIFKLQPRPGTPQNILDRYAYLISNLDNVKHWKKLKELFPLLKSAGDTVGAVAIDSEGNVAAATSTGGVWLKLPGRVGDSPIPGAGFYADNRGGAASATGLGETIIMTMLTRRAVELMIGGHNAEEACVKALTELTARFGSDTAGVIAIDVRGNIAAVHNTEAMPYAFKCREKEYVSFQGLKI